MKVRSKTLPRVAVSAGRLWKLLVAATVVLAIPMAPAAVGAAPLSPDATAAAKAGSAWLSDILESDIPLPVFGSPSWGVTFEAATALAAVDKDNPLIAQVWDSAAANLDDAVQVGGNDFPGRLAQMILLAHTIGENPRSVGPTSADLVARLEATLTPSGLYGVQSPTYDGVYRQGQAIAALVSAGATPDATAIQWLLDQQCKGDFQGAWMAYRADTSTPCISDPVSWVGPDSNAVALAITALNAAVPTNAVAATAIADGLNWLDTDQNDDGGWAIAPWGDTDPNSTAVVIQALLATSSLTDARFGDRNASPLDALLSFQLGDSAPEADRGSFTYPGTADSPNEMATVQAVVAAAGYPLIFLAAAPVDDSPSPTTSTTTVATTSTSTTLKPVSEPPVAQAPAVRAISLAG